MVESVELLGQLVNVVGYLCRAAEAAGVGVDSYIASKINDLFDLRPAKIVEKFGLKNPIYEPTAAYGHVGRTPYKQNVTLVRDGKTVEQEIQFFGWELLDSVDKVKTAFKL